MSLNINIKVLDARLTPDCIGYASMGAAAADLRACIEDFSTWIAPGQVLAVSAGFSMSLPEGYAAMLIPRSGRGTKEGLVLAHGTGLIDSDYRGEVMIPLYNRSNETIYVEAMDRVCQMVIIPVVQASFTVVEDLDETERGAGGFGSTGTKQLYALDLEAGGVLPKSITTYKPEHIPSSVLSGQSEGVHPGFFDAAYLKHVYGGAFNS